MPAVHPPALVLVTSASGFIATHICQQLLRRGLGVRGTVRSAEKGDYPANLFKEFGDKFRYVIVKDMEVPGCFDETVKGVDAVEHTASPFYFNALRADELIGPAVKGTTGVLESIQKHNHSIKRVVVTSSYAAVVGAQKSPATLTESDWNTHSTAIVEVEGDEAPPRENLSREQDAG